MTLSEELTWRGFVNQTTYKDLSVLDGKPITFYWGVDPSADSMTVGNLASAMMVKAFMKHGHHAVLLIGGATGMIGDPDGKAEERSLKTIEEITKYKKAIAGQYQQIFGDQSFKPVDNYEWFKDMNYLEFLRDVGKHVPMRQMLARDFIQTRLGEGGTGISYAEFSYVLIQAYDFLYLYKNENVTLQVCGSDQWGNSIAGVELIRRSVGGEANVYSVPLIVNQSTGTKFGKSEAGAIWLDPAKTDPHAFYQFWINVDDASVEGYLKIFTELDKAAITHVMAEFDKKRADRLAQETLAYEVTKLIHGKALADEAQRDAKNLRLTVSQAVTTDDSLTIAIDTSIVDVLVETKLASSKTEARQLLGAGGIYVNDTQVKRERFEAADFHDGLAKLRRGKTLQNSVVVKLK